MAIRLIKTDEHLTCDMFGVTFHYRRPPDDVIQSLREKNTKRGNLNDEAFARDMLEWAVFNWEGDISADDGGEFVPFEPKLLVALPLKVRLALVNQIADQVDAEHARADPT